MSVSVGIVLESATLCRYLDGDLTRYGLSRQAEPDWEPGSRSVNSTVRPPRNRAQPDFHFNRSSPSTPRQLTPPAQPVLDSSPAARRDEQRRWRGSTPTIPPLSEVFAHHTTSAAHSGDSNGDRLLEWTTNPKFKGERVGYGGLQEKDELFQCAGELPPEDHLQAWVWSPSSSACQISGSCRQQSSFQVPSAHRHEYSPETLA